MKYKPAFFKVMGMVATCIVFVASLGIKPASAGYLYQLKAPKYLEK